MNTEQFTEGLLNFLHASPTPFHAVRTLSTALEHSGYQKLTEAENWTLQPRGRYFVTRNDSSIIAFSIGKNPLEKTGLRIVGAHTDSPCLKIKPHAERTDTGYLQLGVEVYGGALLRPWFDRDLSIAGRIHYTTAQETLKSTLIDLGNPIAIIPSLAIHLDREANTQGAVNAQQHLFPVLLQTHSQQKTPSLKAILQQHLQNQMDCTNITILEHELFLYDTQAPALIGLQQEFIASARLDNLLSCYIGLMSLLEADEQQSCVFICSDHEEVGSQSYCGAHSNFLESVLQRLHPSSEQLARSIAQSWMVSVDNAHATHPNYADKHDPQHLIQLNHGLVIKMNAGQRYATNSETSAFFQSLCQQENIPVQTFVMRNDLACGSTIGPMTSAHLGIKTIDVGVPQWAMHSIRETIGRKDAYFMHQALKAFFNHA